MRPRLERGFAYFFILIVIVPIVFNSMNSKRHRFLCLPVCPFTDSAANGERVQDVEVVQTC